MSEKGKETIEKLAKGLENANDLQREFLFGYAEGIIAQGAENKQAQEKEKEGE